MKTMLAALFFLSLLFLWSGTILSAFFLVVSFLFLSVPIFFFKFFFFLVTFFFFSLLWISSRSPFWRPGKKSRLLYVLT